MSSSMDSSDFESSVDCSEDLSDSDNDTATVNMRFVPYEDEPRANELSRDNMEDGGYAQNDADVDGLTPDTIATRYRGEIPIDEWCECRRCAVQHLVGALEFRCCREVGEALGKLTFDGSIERMSCVTQHEDYIAHTNLAILKNVGPLLRNKDGNFYRRRAGQNENEYIRAVAYHWVVRWMCGYMGWDNSRPLPACVYHNIRDRYRTDGAQTGYATAENRQ